MNRYQVKGGSLSGHCCFEASVVDTHEIGEGIHKNGNVVCECFEVEDAERIARALESVTQGDTT